MARRIGVWIDHERAILAKIDEEGSAHIETLLSGAEPHVPLSGGSRAATAWGPQDVASESHRDRRQHNQLSGYYRRVIEVLEAADAILILGPGEAKAELRREIDRSGGMASRVAGVEPADKMTDRQIAARVKAFFGAEAPRGRSR